MHAGCQSLRLKNKNNLKIPVGGYRFWFRKIEPAECPAACYLVACAAQHHEKLFNRKSPRGRAGWMMLCRPAGVLNWLTCWAAHCISPRVSRDSALLSATKHAVWSRGGFSSRVHLISSEIHVFDKRLRLFTAAHFRSRLLQLSFSHSHIFNGLQRESDAPSISITSTFI